MKLSNLFRRSIIRDAVGDAFGPKRVYTRDMMTYDGVHNTNDDKGNHRGKPMGAAFTTHDGHTVDSTGAFLVGELERIDMTINDPLVDVQWGRDIEVNEGTSLADEVMSYTVSSYGSAGGLGTGAGIRNGKAWIGKATTQIARVSVDIAKVTHPLTTWALEVAYTVLELESSVKLGRPVDEQQIAALRLKHQMDIDEQVYVGDATIAQTGILNADNRPTGLDKVTNVANVPNGAGGSSLWANKTPAEILADVNEIIISTWTASGYAVMPNRLLVPPSNFGYISTQNIAVTGTTGGVSILKYLMENNISITSGRGRVEIFPTKWAIGAGVGGTIGTTGEFNRMMAYNKDRRFMNFPMTLLQRTPLQYDSIYQKFTYYCKLGVPELRYPETIAVRDSI